AAGSRGAQAATSVSGTVRDEAEQSVVKTLVALGSVVAASDYRSRFVVLASPGLRPSRVFSPQDQPFSKLLAVKRGQPAARNDPFNPDVVRGFVKEAVAEWGPQHANVLLILNAKVHELWPGIIDERIVVAKTSTISIFVASPYLLYKTQISEAIRKLKTPTDITYPTVVGVSVS